MTLIDTGECGRFQVNPDVATSEPMENDDTIYSVERFGKTPLLTDIKELFIFGFPSYQNVTNDGRYRVKNGISFAVKTFTIFENYSYRYKGESEKVDSINYKITIKDKTVTDSLKGYSGSPVFGRRNEKSRWILLGLLCAGNTKSNDLFIVKYCYVLNKINAIKNTSNFFLHRDKAKPL